MNLFKLKMVGGILLFFLILQGCRQDMLQREDNPQHYATAQSRFQVVKLHEIPQVTDFIKKKTGRNDLMIPIAGKSSALAKGALEFSTLETDFILKTTQDSLVYYIFNISNAGDESTIYNFEVKEIGGDVVRAELIEYASATPFEEDYSNLHSFTGTVTAYNENRDAISVGIFDSGDNGECPPPPSGEPGNPSPGGSDGTIIISPGSGEDPLNPSPWPNWPSGGASQDETISPGPKCGYWQFTYNSAGNPVSATNGCDTVIYRLSNIHSKLTPHCNDGSGVIILPGTKPKTPCELTKELLQKDEVKQKINDLKDHLVSNSGEKGWKFMKDGTPAQLTTQNGDYSVNFGNPSLLTGGYHCHPKIGMFSPADISALIEIARYQGVNSQSVPSDAFLGMVANYNIHYIIIFNGAQSALPAYPYAEDYITSLTVDMLGLAYYYLFNKPEYVQVINNEKVLNADGRAALFFETITRMGLQNKVNLLHIDDNSIFNVKQTPNGPQNEPCK